MCSLWRRGERLAAAPGRYGSGDSAGVRGQVHATTVSAVPATGATSTPQNYHGQNWGLAEIYLRSEIPMHNYHDQRSWLRFTYVLRDRCGYLYLCGRAGAHGWRHQHGGHCRVAPHRGAAIGVMLAPAAAGAATAAVGTGAVHREPSVITGAKRVCQRVPSTWWQVTLPANAIIMSRIPASTLSNVSAFTSMMGQVRAP